MTRISLFAEEQLYPPFLTVMDSKIKDSLKEERIPFLINN